MRQVHDKKKDKIITQIQIDIKIDQRKNTQKHERIKDFKNLVIFL